MKSPISWTGAIVLSLAAGLLLLEAVYRLPPFGFYSRELKAFNSKDDLAGPGNRATVLIFGDSFTALNENHANVLRATLPNLRIINSGIPGTGIIQTSLPAGGSDSWTACCRKKGNAKTAKDAKKRGCNWVGSAAFDCNSAPSTKYCEPQSHKHNIQYFCVYTLDPLHL